MPTPRTPRAIAADARALIDKASKAFVPANLVHAMELSVEFMESVAAMTPPDEPAALATENVEPAAALATENAGA